MDTYNAMNSGGGFGIGIYIIFGIFMLISFVVQQRLRSKFAKYSKVGLQAGLTGREVAEKMLADNGIHDVKVISVRGQLTDHYNPVNKTVNLSEGVYNSRSVAAAGVAAHECGHAVQHATAYQFLKMRSKLVPVISISSKYLQWILLAGILLVNTFPQVLMIGIGLFALTTLFSFITLPVEYNASARAVTWLDSNQIVTQQEKVMVKDALKWAARTYLMAALTSLATLFYYLSFLRD